MRSTNYAVVSIAVCLLTYLLPGTELAVGKLIALIERQKQEDVCLDALLHEPTHIEAACARI